MAKTILATLLTTLFLTIFVDAIIATGIAIKVPIIVPAKAIVILTQTEVSERSKNDVLTIFFSVYSAQSHLNIFLKRLNRAGKSRNIFGHLDSIERNEKIIKAITNNVIVQKNNRFGDLE